MFINTRWQLNDGCNIPILGFGLYQVAPGIESQQSIRWAIQAGYRHFDTAALYQNEEDLGLVLRESVLLREEVYVTTKLWNSDHGYDQAKRALDVSLKKLKLEYVDLYLIHWPVEEKRLDSWRALISLKNEGKVKSIGVSNYTIRHLTELLDTSTVSPAVNQVEFHTFLYQKELNEFCIKQNIQLAAYSPLMRGKKLDDKTLVEIAQKYHKSPAQIMLRWCLQHQVIPIVKSSSQKRILENIAIFDFEINEHDMNVLDQLNRNRHVAWDPTHAP